MAFDLKQKQKLGMVEDIARMKHIFKRWLNYVGIKFLQSRETTEEEEVLLGEIVDFYYDYLNKIEKDKSFLKRVTLDPVKLPEVKKSN